MARNFKAKEPKLKLFRYTKTRTLSVQSREDDAPKKRKSKSWKLIPDSWLSGGAVVIEDKEDLIDGLTLEDFLAYFGDSGTAGGAILMETGSYVLMEDGSSHILLEA